jgi:hypothetical protein
MKPLAPAAFGAKVPERAGMGVRLISVNVGPLYPDDAVGRSDGGPEDEK